MRILLDTHIFLWWINDTPELSPKARKAIANPANECLVSMASHWEMAIKLSLGKLKIGGNFATFVPEQLALNGFHTLGVEFRHTARLIALPFHHRDPFDRLLAAQALEEKLPIVSADPVFRHYGVKQIG